MRAALITMLPVLLLTACGGGGGSGGGISTTSPPLINDTPLGENTSPDDGASDGGSTPSSDSTSTGIGTSTGGDTLAGGGGLPGGDTSAGGGGLPGGDTSAGGVGLPGGDTSAGGGGLPGGDTSTGGGGLPGGDTSTGGGGSNPPKLSPPGLITKLDGRTSFPLWTAGVKGNNNSKISTLSHDSSITFTPIRLPDGSLSTAVDVSIHNGTHFEQSFTPDDYAGKTAISNDFGILRKGSDQFIFHEPATDDERLSYNEFGLWNHPGESLEGKSAGPFSVGLETPVSAMPRTGTANYTGQTVGGMVTGIGTDDRRTYEISGKTSLTADFGNRSITATFDRLQGVEVKPDNTHGAVQPIDSITANAAIMGNRFSGTVAQTGQNVTGSIGGSFYGPQAQEVGGVWTLNGPQTSAEGSFGAKR